VTAPDIDVSFVIATHNRREILRTLLDALRESDLEGLSTEVIVSTDHCVDGTQEMIGQYACLDLPFELVAVEVPDGSRGHSATSNVGFRIARGAKILLGDDDRIVNGSYIKALAAPVKPGVATVAGGTGDEAVGIDWASFRAQRRPPDWREFTCTGMWREDLFAVGGMDENLSNRFGYADIDLGVRFWMYGCEFIFVEEATYDHRTNLRVWSPEVQRTRRMETAMNARYLSEKLGFIFPPFHMLGLQFRYPNDDYFDGYRTRFGFL
jgi:glycosyltransferase involved in cell wall biosynthesis